MPGIAELIALGDTAVPLEFGYVAAGYHSVPVTRALATTVDGNTQRRTPIVGEDVCCTMTGKLQRVLNSMMRAHCSPSRARPARAAVPRRLWIL